LAKAKAKFDLAIVSVLLDAGAGDRWQYKEQGTGTVWRRSEGLAIASLHAFCQGIFSSDPQLPLQADAIGLQNLTEEALSQAFQVSQDNPLVGVQGRLALLQRLGTCHSAAAYVVWFSACTSWRTGCLSARSCPYRTDS
jgi:hypothetical protein